MALAERIAAARGDVRADLVLRNATLYNVLSGDIYPTDIVIHDGYVVALGPGYEAAEEIDLTGMSVCPGFMDAHVHIESSLCTPPEYARTVLPRGVTSVMTDPHEIANVLGADGISYMIERGRETPFNMFVMASSCVPATDMETSGARLEADDLAPLLKNPMVLGLAEMMNYPGVIYGDDAVLAKLDAFAGMPLDGHAPSVTGKPLNAYVAAGIHSDHECTTVEEAREKLRLGLTIFIREGTTTRNLKPLLPLVTPMNHTRMCFCTDDRQPNSLLDEGAIDHMVRVAIAEGLDPMMALRMATINTANYFRLYDRGAVAVGRRADIVVFKDVKDLRASMVFRDGLLVARDGAMIAGRAPVQQIPVRPSMNVAAGALDFRVHAAGARIHVIGTDPDQVVSENLILDAKIEDELVVSDIERDILKIATIERHKASGNIAKGFIQGVGLKRGAIAGSVAHDHHNIIVIGVDDVSIEAAVRAVMALGGGLAVADGGSILGTLALPVAGLMTDAPMEDVRRDYDALITLAHELGSTMHDPFMLMSFMGLEVIPSLKLTDIGLVDVEKFAVIDLFDAGTTPA